MIRRTLDLHLPPRPHATTAGIFAARVLLLVFALGIFSLLSTGFFSNAQGLVSYTVLLLWYLFVEAIALWTRDKRLFWLNPIIIASIFSIALPFGISNIVFALPAHMIVRAGLQTTVTVWMNQLMLLVILGGSAMWIGYGSKAGRSLGGMLQRNTVLKSWMSLSTRVRKSTIWTFVLISLIARLFSIKMGIYGYSATDSSLMAGAGYREYLAYAESLGRLALVGLAIESFAPGRKDLTNRLALISVFCYEVLFGFLSGFKTPVVLPLVIVGMAFYSQRNRFPRWIVPAIVVGVLAAYAVIEPFRATRNDDPTFDGTSLSGIISTMSDETSMKAYDIGAKAPVGIQFLARNNLTYMGSLGIEYASLGKLPPGSPDFLADLFLVPVHAVIPRAIWSSKPIVKLGLWYTNVVLGKDLMSSAAMSPFTYLNFAGGPLAVILGFLFVGIIQRGLFDGLRSYGGGGVIVLLGLLTTLGVIDSAFDTVFIYVIRLFPMLVVAQYLMIERQRK